MHPLLVRITCIVFLKSTTQASIFSQSFIVEIDRLKTVREVLPCPYKITWSRIVAKRYCNFMA